VNIRHSIATIPRFLLVMLCLSAAWLLRPCAVLAQTGSVPEQESTIQPENLIQQVSTSTEEEISFNSDFQEEVKDEKVLLLQGNVEVHFRGSVIYADEVRVNDDKGEFFGVGNVRYVGQDRDIFGDSIWYNYNHDDFDMRNTHGSMLASGVSEPVWFTAEQLRGNVNNYKMVNGRVTTCTPDEHREYHIEAQAIKVLPGNKIIFRNGYFFIMNMPILWFPYWAFSVAETPWVVEVGKDNFQGIYVKTRYNYLAEDLIIGSIILQYLSRTGWVAGMDHSYVLPKQGSGTIRWTAQMGTYNVPSATDLNDNDVNSITDIRKAKHKILHANTYDVNLTQQLVFGSRFSGNITLHPSSSYQSARGRTNSVNGSLSTSYNMKKSRTSFNFTGQTTSGSSQSSTINMGLQFSQDVMKNLSSSLRMDYSVNKQSKSGPADEDFVTHAEFRQNLKNWNWNAVYHSHWDPDGFTYLPDRSKAYTDKMPEINLTFQPNAFPSKMRNMLGFEMQALNMQGALLYIGPERKEVNGFYGRFDTRFQRTDKLKFFSKEFGDVQSSLEYWQAISSTGDAQYTYSWSSNWNWKLLSRAGSESGKPPMDLTSQIGWNRSDGEGRIPLSGYDRPGSPRNSLTYNLRYTMGSVINATMSTSYSLNERYSTAPGHILSIKRLVPLSFSMNYVPNNKTTVTVSTQYDLTKGFSMKGLGDIRTSLKKQDFRSFTLQTNMNIRPQGPDLITSLSNVATFIIGPDWDFTVDSELIGTASNSVIRNVRITHRLDCTFLYFEYRAQSNEWVVTWGITAMPSAHLGYSTNEPAFGPDFFNTFGGSGSGFNAGGLGSYGGYGGSSGYGF
jgi:hypothetical protein